MSVISKFFGRTVSFTSPTDDPNSFGNIALEKQFITPRDLEEALAKQREDRMLGQVLIAMAKLTQLQCEEILIEQQKRKATTREDVVLLEMRQQRVATKRMQLSLTNLTDQMASFQEPLIKKSST